MSKSLPKDGFKWLDTAKCNLDQICEFPCIDLLLPAFLTAYPQKKVDWYHAYLS